MAIDWKSYGEYEMTVAADKSMEGSTKGVPSDWRKAKFLRPLSATEALLFGAGGGTEWNFGPKSTPFWLPPTEAYIQPILPCCRRSSATTAECHGGGRPVGLAGSGIVCRVRRRQLPGAVQGRRLQPLQLPAVPGPLTLLPNRCNRNNAAANNLSCAISMPKTRPAHVQQTVRHGLCAHFSRCDIRMRAHVQLLSHPSILFHLCFFARYLRALLAYLVCMCSFCTSSIQAIQYISIGTSMASMSSKSTPRPRPWKVLPKVRDKASESISAPTHPHLQSGLPACVLCAAVLLCMAQICSAN